MPKKSKRQSGKLHAAAANWPPEIVGAMRALYDEMGFGFDPEGLSQFHGNIDLAMSLGLPPREIAGLLIDKITAAHIEHGLPKCIKQLGDTAVLVSMPLEDLRFAYGYLAMVDVGGISQAQTKRAVQIALKLDATTAS